MWCPIEFCKAKWGRAKSYAFICKVLVSEWPSYDTILHWITIPPVPWWIARLYLYTDTKLDEILSWADINRNGNRFFVYQGVSGSMIQGMLRWQLHSSPKEVHIDFVQPVSPSHWPRPQVMSNLSNVLVVGWPSLKKRLKLNLNDPRLGRWPRDFRKLGWF